MSATAPAPRLRRGSTADDVGELLRARIESGDLAPGTPLREVALAQSIGVSRPTLREALQALKREGLVHHEVNRGMSVTALGPAEIVDIYQVRAVLETSAARACAAAPDASLDAVGAAFEALSAAWGGEDAILIEADLSFHRAIVALLGSSRLDDVFASVVAALRPCLTLLSREARATVLRSDSLEEHAAIAAALGRRDAELGESLIAAHIDANRELILGVVGVGRS